jgi:FMN-binding protein
LEEPALRRTVLALVGFTLAVAVLVGLKAPATARLLGWSAEAGLAADQLNAADTAPGTSGDPAASGPGGSAAPGASLTPGASGSTAPSGPAGTASAPAGTTNAPPPTTAAPPPVTSRTILGPAVATTWNGNNYGTTQVKIVVTGTHIDDIIAVKQGSRPGTTATTLRAQALAAQSANVGNVSGATASSNAYKQSLQGAIAQI